MASQGGRIDFFVRKRSAEQERVSTQMLFEQVNPARMHRHHGRIRQFRLPCPQLAPGTDAFLRVLDSKFRVTVRLGRDDFLCRLPSPRPSSSSRASPSAFNVSHGPITHPGTGAHPFEQAASSFEFDLEASAIERVLYIGGAHLAKHLDDVVLSDVRRIRHGRAPVAIGKSASRLVNSLGSFNTRLRTASASPRQIASVRRQAALAGANSVGHSCGPERVGRPQVSQRRVWCSRGGIFWNSATAPESFLPNSAKKILRLISKLIEVGANREVAIVELLRHDGPPLWSRPASAQRAKKEVRKNLDCRKIRSGGLGPVRGRAASCTPKVSIRHRRTNRRGVK